MARDSTDGSVVSQIETESQREAELYGAPEPHRETEAHTEPELQRETEIQTETVCQTNAIPPATTVPQTNTGINIPKAQLKRATKTRKTFAIISSLFLVVTVILLILVEIGSVSNLAVLGNFWFIKLNLSGVVPSGGPGSGIGGNNAQSLGLHGFYQVGLWNFCKGHSSGRVTKCSTPRALYWFNPVAIIKHDLHDQMPVMLPSEFSNILHVSKPVSHWMFGLFLTGASLSFIMIFIAPVSLYSRWYALLIALVTGLNALFIIAASTLATALFSVMRDVFIKNQQVNIGATVGTAMFACMWAASVFATLAFVINSCLMCCCTSRRDIKTGRKRGGEKAYEYLP